MTPKNLAKRIHAFETDAVSDQDYKDWCEEIGSGFNESWMVSNQGFKKEDIRRYNTLLFSDARFDFVHMLKPKSKKERLSNEAYGYLGKNPMIPMLVETGDETFNRHLEKNSTSLFVSLLMKAVQEGSAAISMDTFHQWKPDWDWSFDTESWDNLQHIMQNGPYTEEDKLDEAEVQGFAFDLFYALWDQIEQTDKMDLVKGSMSIFDLCHRFEDALGLPRQPHILSFLEQVDEA